MNIENKKMLNNKMGTKVDIKHLFATNNGYSSEKIQWKKDR